MLEQILGMTAGATLADLGALAALTSIIVQVLKHIVPSKFPTRALAIIVAIFVTVLASILFYGLMWKAVGIGIIAGFVTAFIAMEGFDNLKSIWGRFTTLKVEETNVEEEIVSGGVGDEFDDEPFDDEGGED